MKIITQEELNKIDTTSRGVLHPVVVELIKLEVGQILEIDFDEIPSVLGSIIYQAKLKSGFNFGYVTAKELKKWYVTRKS